jgi:hypothetical protein
LPSFAAEGQALADELCDVISTAFGELLDREMNKMDVRLAALKGLLRSMATIPAEIAQLLDLPSRRENGPSN